MIPKTILAVDDEVFNLQLIEEYLGETYTILKATNGKEALEKTMFALPDLILLDIRMPVMDGIEFLERFHPVIEERLIPVIILTAYPDRETKLKAFSLGCWDFITKPIDLVELKLRVKNALELKSYKDKLEDKVRERTRDLQGAYDKIKKTQLEIVRRLGKAAEFRDDETGDHIIRTSKYVYVIAKALGLPEEECDLFYHAAPMHDIGKIGIPDVILLKPGKLTQEEFEIIKLHTLIGAEILSGTDLPLLEKAKETALTHHEKWDGTGYPRGLKGEEIPLSGRIMAIADVFDALTSKRVYKPPSKVEEALDFIKSQKNKHFDPEIVDAFLEVQNKILQIREMYKKKEQKSKLKEIMKKIKLYRQKLYEVKD
ncbi:MAG: response regulator [Candidatus Desulfofervidaceae bacterium]|nr:response regulator [Candidatus Desulfofervidaceae bacterium]